MHFSLSALALIGTAAAVPAVRMGFTIPEGTPDGAYNVTYSQGKAVIQAVHPHQESATAVKLAREAVVNNGDKLQTRAYTDLVQCGGYELNHSECDDAVAELKNHLGNIVPKVDNFIVRGATVAYVCNFGNNDYSVGANWYGDRLGAVTRTCGLYGAGWQTLQDTDYWVTGGYEYVSNSKVFCGRGHN